MKPLRPIDPYKNDTEKEITAAIRSVLNVLNVWHYKHWQGPMSQPRGVSDIIGIWQGRYLAIEVKRPGLELTKYQELFINRVNKEGGLAFMAKSVDDVIDKLGVRDRFLF